MVATGLATLLAWVVATFPFENTSPEDRHALALVLPGGIAFVFAALTLSLVALGRGRIALGAFTIHVVAGVAFLLRALSYSDRSDGKLIAFGLAIEFVGATAVLLAPIRN